MRAKAWPEWFRDGSEPVGAAAWTVRSESRRRGASQPGAAETSIVVHTVYVPIPKL